MNKNLKPQMVTCKNILALFLMRKSCVNKLLVVRELWIISDKYECAGIQSALIIQRLDQIEQPLVTGQI